ncbi:hypothetical protein B0T09DRAFT_298272 [Sordaria sp. MPI-SDFR-AT-0083]|nr:hypothetical protein B0T09DRAFT_298272 [Sordaria sp. MPI-SDFR-AT-0083]
MASFLITGASRGLGLAFVKELASRKSSEVSKIFAGARNNVAALQELFQNDPRVHFVKLDVSNQESVKEAAAEVEKQLEGKGLDVLINNAAICHYDMQKMTNPTVEKDIMREMNGLEEEFLVNVLGVQYTTRDFLPLLEKSELKKVVNITSTFGSISSASDTAVAWSPCPAYKISKAALNALTVQYALEYQNKGFSFIALCPGWLKTDIGSEMADLTSEEGAKASLEIILAPGQEYNGKFPMVKVKGWETKEEAASHGGYAGNNVYDGRNISW